MLSTSNILSIIALIFVAIGGALIRVLTRRAFESITETSTRLQKEINSASHKILNLEKDIIRVQGAVKSVEDVLRAEFTEKFLARADFIRDIQLLNSQVESIYKKIDHVDDKLDTKLNSLRKG